MNELEVTIVESATAATAAATAAAEVAAADARDAYESARTLTAVAIAVAAVLSLAGGLLRRAQRPAAGAADARTSSPRWPRVTSPCAPAPSAGVRSWA